MEKEKDMKDYQQILSLFGSDTEIPRPQVRQWMESNDLRVLGALFALADSAWRRIKPELETDEYYDFILKYTLRCIIEGHEEGYIDDLDDYVDSRYIAAFQMARIVIYLHGIRPEANKVLEKILIAFKKLYIESNKEIQDCIIYGFLEHVFEEKEIIELFQDWQDDPRLTRAYYCATCWGKEYWDKDVYSDGRKKRWWLEHK